ncbi:MAG: hypothetical protein WCF84_26300 [Anaerolineae bacterium]
MGISLQEIITIITLLAGAYAIYRQYRQDTRSTLKDDYDRVHQQRDEYRTRCDGQKQDLEKLQQELSTVRGENAALKAECEILRVGMREATEIIHRMQLATTPDRTLANEDAGTPVS